MNWTKKYYNYEEIIGAFNAAVENFINDSKRVVGRTYSPEAVEEYAENLYKDHFKGIVHPFVIDPYRANYHQNEAKKQAEVDVYIAKLPK